jgi:DNA-binding transcriptional MerR regulator
MTLFARSKSSLSDSSSLKRGITILTYGWLGWMLWSDKLFAIFVLGNIAKYKTRLSMKKLYYSIGEVSQLTNVEAHRIRYWETRFSQLQPEKTSNGKRKFKESDIDLILKLKELILDKKMSTEGAKAYLDGKTSKKAKPIKKARLNKDLRQIRSFLVDLRDLL